MQEALPYRSWPLSTATSGGSTSTTTTITSTEEIDGASSNIKKMVSENAVIVFGRRGCCMCHVVKQLLLGLGVNPTIFFVDEEDESAMIGELSRIDSADGDVDGDVSVKKKVQFPAVFVGGKLFGGLERVMSTHITGELVPMLREARALWL